jgi:hypothetical protein
MQQTPEQLLADAIHTNAVYSRRREELRSSHGSIDPIT